TAARIPPRLHLMRVVPLALMGALEVGIGAPRKARPVRSQRSWAATDPPSHATRSEPRRTPRPGTTIGADLSIARTRGVAPIGPGRGSREAREGGRPTSRS